MIDYQNRSTEELFQQAKTLHLSHRTQSPELEDKLDFMTEKIEDHSSFLACGFCGKSSKKVNDAYKRAFKKLNLTEQVHLFWKMCSLISHIKDHKKEPEEHEIKNPQKEMLDTTIYIKDKKQYKNWTVTRIKASLRTKKIVITDTSVVIDLHDYLIRGAKNKEKECFALEATNLQQAVQTIKISNEGHSFNETINFLYKMKRRALFDELCAIIDPNLLQKQGNTQQNHNNSKLMRKSSVKTSNLPIDLNSIYDRMITLKLVSPEYGKKPMKLVEKQILQRQRVIRFRDSSYNQIYKALLPGKLLSKIQDFSGWQKVRGNDSFSVFYQRNQQKVRKVYKMRCSDIVIFDWIVDELNNFSNFKKWKPRMDQIRCLKVFPSEKTKIYHEVCRHEENKKVNYVFVRHHFDMPNLQSQNSKKQYFYYDQSVASPIAKNFFSVGEPLGEISYILWKFYEDQDMANLVVEAKCDHFVTLEKNLKMIDDYLGDFDSLKKHAANYTEEDDEDSDLVLNTLLFQNQYIQKIDEIQDIDHDTEYYTVSEQNNSNKEKTFLSKKTNLNNSKSISIKPRVSFEKLNQSNIGNILKFRHPVVPYPKTKPKLVTPTMTGGHFHWEKEWKITSKGELINTNKEKIAAQNNVLKNVFKRLGKNLFSGKGILSISLPVDAFGEDSNLSRLCNSYGYAPIFLQEAARQTDPLERFKKVMSFGISASVIYIRMDKPFNPILGETYQSLIDGCPVYGEQISHHPPISSVFLKGRGFTLYGHLQAKVEMSFNSASGINDGEINVSFDDNDLSKSKIIYTSPAGELAGLIYGDRRMSLIKNSVYFDEENLIHCELKWCKQKGKSEFINKYYDAVEGQIVKLKSNFDRKNWRCIKKEDIEKEYGLVNGRWTGAVFYDNQLMFDTYKTHPHEVELYPAMLESDVEKRKDLLLRRKAVDMEPAQQAKEELEEIQRNDRKLRAKYTGGKGH